MGDTRKRKVCRRGNETKTAEIDKILAFGMKLKRISIRKQMRKEI